MIERQALVVGLFIAACCSASARAQAPRPDSGAFPKLAVDGAVGLVIPTAPTSYAGYKMSASIALPQDQAVIVRYLNVEEFCLFDTCSRPDRVAELGVLYGLTPHNYYVRATAAAGLGVVTSLTENHETGIRRRVTQPAIPTELAGYIRFTSSVAIGLGGIVDLIPDRSMAGLFVSLRIGFD